MKRWRKKILLLWNNEKSEKSKRDDNKRSRGFEPETFGFVGKRPKRSAIEDIPRCLYDIQFLSLILSL